MSSRRLLGGGGPSGPERSGGAAPALTETRGGEADHAGNAGTPAKLGALTRGGVLLCGGGTGGHVLPGLAVAEALRRRGLNDLRWIGDPDRIEANLVPGAGIPLLPLGLSRPALRSPGWWRRSLAMAWKVHRELSRNRPEAIIALGGYASLLPALLAPIHRIPLVVMEQNAHAGRTNRLTSRYAAAIITQFPEASAHLRASRVQMLGNPVRAIAPRPRGQGQDLTVLVVGGSLSAKSLNDLLVAAAPSLAVIPGLKLIHLAGDDDRARVAEAYAAVGLSAEVHGFYRDMPGLYERVDLAVTRAGATTVAELCSAGIGALYIPLPWAAEDHQTANARSIERIGGAVVLPQATTTPTDLAAAIARLVQDRAAVGSLGEQARTLARPDAADAVADLVLRLARPRS